MPKTHVSMTVNGNAVEGLVEPRTLLIHFLREDVGLTGPHIGCETTHCGACTVDLDGKSVKSCTVFAVQADGASILTIEGIAAPDGTLHALQEGFREMHGLQCGFCTPGHDHARLPPACRKIRTRAKRRSASASPAISAAAPAIRTSSRPFNTPPPRSAAHSSRRPRNERDRADIRRARRKARGPRLQAQAGRRHSLRPRQGQLRRRPQAAGHALRRFRALAARPCADQDRSTSPRR